MTNRLTALTGALVLAFAVRAWGQPSPHNLVPPGPRDPGAPTTCGLCHPPHTGEPTQALWSRDLPGVTYKLYESVTLQASLNQPTGSSRLCLSCHDGTVALANTATSPTGQSYVRMPAGATLGTDLSDDHPISFAYDAALTARNHELVDPKALPPAVSLDRNKQLQCTSCHDPHERRFSKMLLVDPKFSALCTSCHRLDGWTTSAHASSTATWNGAGASPWPRSELKTVAENGCQNCHRMHTAGRGPWLLNSADEEKNCLSCHNTTVAAKDVERDFKKFSAHPLAQSAWTHNPREDPLSMPRHVACADCHDPHGVQAASAAGSGTAVLGRVKGINVSGARVAQASAEFELCFTCHGVTEQPRATMTRADHVTNVRLEFDPANASSHPVVASARDPIVRGLEGGFSTNGLIRCSDCHASDSAPTANGTKGPHGSIYEPILERQYDTNDPNPESGQAYALCYKCHNRMELLSDRGGFPHRRHVVGAQASCAVCHDAHGARRSSSLVNFMTLGRSGRQVVTPASTGQLEFTSLGRGRGRCALSCHGTDHRSTSYP